MKLRTLRVQKQNLLTRPLNMVQLVQPVLLAVCLVSLPVLVLKLSNRLNLVPSKSLVIKLQRNKVLFN